MLAMAASPSSYAIQESNARRHQSSSWSVQLYGENGVVGSKNSNGFDAAFVPSHDASGPVSPGNFTDAFYSVMAIRALTGTPSADYYEKVKHHFQSLSECRLDGVSQNVSASIQVLFIRT